MIMNNNKLIQKNFIAGFFDTDGGRRGNGIGFTMKNQKLQLDTSILLNNLNIKHYKESWLNKKYNSRYYGIKINTSQTKMFLYEFPLRNKSRLNSILSLFYAEMPEWSNGIEN